MPDFEILQQPDVLQIPLDNNWLVIRENVTIWNPLTNSNDPMPAGVHARGYLARKVIDSEGVETYDLITTLDVDPLSEIVRVRDGVNTRDYYGKILGTALRAVLVAGEVIYEVVEIGDEGEYRDVVELLVVEASTPEIVR